MTKGPNGEKRPRDTNQLAKFIVDHATMDEEQLAELRKKKERSEARKARLRKTRGSFRAIGVFLAALPPVLVAGTLEFVAAGVVSPSFFSMRLD